MSSDPMDPAPIDPIDPADPGPRESLRERLRDDVWGDEKSELDAEAVVEEFDEEHPEAGRRWYEHPAAVPFTAVARFIGRNGKRIAVTIAGFAVLLAGVALLVLPGPGWLLIFVGLGILSTEYVWARKLLVKAKEKAEQAKDAVLRKKGQEPAEAGSVEAEAESEAEVGPVVAVGDTSPEGEDPPAPPKD
jgi:hypothetical protein